jgi:RNA-binding protein
MPLTKERQRALKAQAHSLKPVVLLGQKGLTAPVIIEINAALDCHELIKVKVPGEDRDARQHLIQDIVAQTQADLIGTIGHIAILYRKNKDK